MTDIGQHAEARPNDLGDDRALLTRLQSGDSGALDRIIKTYWPALLRYAARLLKDRDAAQDLVQETFVRLWERRASLENGSLRAFCYRVVHNLVIDELRRRRLRALWTFRFRGQSETSQESSDLVLLRTEREVAVSQAIEALPARRRQAFVLAHLHGLSYREVAEVMGVSAATVKNQVAASLAQLRRALQAHLTLPADLE